MATASIRSNRTPIRTTYHGLRMTAAEYLELPDDGKKYELIDGVVIMSPSPTPRHQAVSLEILRQLANFAVERQVGLVLHEVDVVIGKTAEGRDLVYRPEIVFIAAERALALKGRIDIVPDLVVEVISPDSRGLDSRTKLEDYERARVREYWLIDPDRRSMTFFRLKGRRFTRATAGPRRFESRAVPGFCLDLKMVRATFAMLG